jgi:hypothetical protein
MDQYALTSDLVIGDKSLDPTSREGLQQFVFFSKFHTSIAIPLKIDATSDFSNLSRRSKGQPPLARAQRRARSLNPPALRQDYTVPL